MNYHISTLVRSAEKKSPSKWNGELPGVVAGESATVVIPTPAAE